MYLGRAVAIALMLATQAHAREDAKPSYPVVDDLAAKFASEPLPLAFSISPSGDAIAYVSRHDTARVVTVYDIATQQTKMVQSDKGLKLHFRACTFKTDVRLICSMSSDVFKLFSSSLVVSRHVALDRDGGNALALGSTGRRNVAAIFTSGYIIDQLPDDPQHVLSSYPVQTSTSPVLT